VPFCGLKKVFCCQKAFVILFARAARASQNQAAMSKQMTPYTSPAPFASAHIRARIVKILLIVGAVATGLTFLSEALSFVFPPLTDDQELGDNPIGAVLSLFTFLFALFEFVIYWATVVFFLVWLYRAYNNLRAFDPDRPNEYSTGWALGSFFIPFVNLIIPYRAIKETWQKSGPSDEALLSAPSPPAWFSIWWMFWLLSSMAGNLSLRLSLDENVSERIATMVSMVAGALSIVAAVFAYVVVNAIDKRQEETSGKLRLGNLPVPPPPPTNLPISDAVVP
jgi:hypothetical protein